MKKYRPLVVAMLLTVTLSSHARTIIGAGTTSCGEYTEYANSSRDEFKSRTIDIWVLGFISALNVGAYKFDMLKDTDGPSIRGALKLYCEKNPLSKVIDGALDIATQLAERAAPANTSSTESKPKKK